MATICVHTGLNLARHILESPCHIISKGLWPLCSPDLTPPDYFLWGYLKGRVYQNKPRTIGALKANITEEIQAVTADVLARIFQNMARRVQSCLDANGSHFQHMLWCHISHTTNVLLFKFRYNIFIDVRIIKEMPGLGASGTLCILILAFCNTHQLFYTSKRNARKGLWVMSDCHRSPFYKIKNIR